MTRLGKAEREKREAAWKAEQERVRKLGNLFEALPDGPQKAALQEALSDRVIELYNNVRFEEGDAILEFLPNEYARKLLDWYFDEDGPTSFPPETTASEDEDSQSRQIQSEPQGDRRAHGLDTEQAPAGSGCQAHR